MLKFLTSQKMPHRKFFFVQSVSLHSKEVFGCDAMYGLYKVVSFFVFPSVQSAQLLIFASSLCVGIVFQRSVVKGPSLVDFIL